MLLKKIPSMTIEEIKMFHFKVFEIKMNGLSYTIIVYINFNVLLKQMNNIFLNDSIVNSL